MHTIQTMLWQLARYDDGNVHVHHCRSFKYICTVYKDFVKSLQVEIEANL